MRQDGIDRRGVPDQDVGDAFDIVEIDHRNARLRQRLVGGNSDDGGVIEMEPRLADSCTSAHRLAEPTRTSVAPAMRWVCESFPGWSMSNAWWACFTVDTVSPRATKRGMTWARSVVLPEPLQPARPMMRMPAL